jgi:hypothetical protein
MSQYAYTQTRLQARHALRPGDSAWRYVETQKELTGYLQSARRTELRQWVLALHTRSPYHTLEATLLHQYRDYIEQTARWQPGPWREAVRWVKRLPDLPALQHLLLGNTAPAWMLEDRQLKPFTSVNLNQRLLALQQSDCAPLLQAWQSGLTLVDAWITQWRARWPAAHVKIIKPIDILTDLLQSHREEFNRLPPDEGWRARQMLTHKLTHLFRLYTNQPATVFVHLALVALDIERLRGGIARRGAFADVSKVAQP